MSLKKELKILSCLSQKGGVSKSSLAASIATYLSNKNRVLLADMDNKQASTYEWSLYRYENRVEPEVEAAKFNSFQTVAKSINPSKIDYLVVDGAANSEKQSLLIGVNSDLVIIPTCPSVVDINPQIRFAHALKNAGLDEEKILFVFTKVGSSKKEYMDARAYLEEKIHFKVAQNHIDEKTAFRLAWREGKSFVEVPFPTLRKKANMLISEIVDLLNI